MRPYVVRTADSGDLARDGRAAAMSRRRALAAGQAAVAPAAELPGPAPEVDAPLAKRGRAFSMQRRRQLAQGKQALTGRGAAGPALVVHRGGAG